MSSSVKSLGVRLQRTIRLLEISQEQVSRLGSSATPTDTLQVEELQERALGLRQELLDIYRANSL